MADNTGGVIQAEVRLNLAKLQGDLRLLQTGIQTAGKQLGKYVKADVSQIQTLSYSFINALDTMSTRSASSIYKFKDVLIALNKEYEKLLKSSIKTNAKGELVKSPETASYEQAVLIINQLLGKIDSLELSRAKSHTKEKERAKEEAKLKKEQIKLAKQQAKEEEEAAGENAKILCWYTCCQCRCYGGCSQSAPAFCCLT